MSKEIQAEAIKKLFLIVRKYEDSLRRYVSKVLKENFSDRSKLSDAINNEKSLIQKELSVNDKITSEWQLRLKWLKEITEKNRIWSIYSSSYKDVRFYDLILTFHVFDKLFDKYIRSIARDKYQFFSLLNLTKEIRNSFSHDQLDEIWENINKDNINELNGKFDFKRIGIGLPPVFIISFVLQSYGFLKVELKEPSLELYIQECEDLINLLTNSTTHNNLSEIEDQFRNKLIMRENELDNYLVKYILKGNRCSYAILGMGGVGKSKLAYEFAVRASDEGELNFIFWISSKEEEIKVDSIIGFKINTIKAKFQTAEEFVLQFCSFRGITLENYNCENLLAYLKDYKGLFVFDNFDNLSSDVRENIFNFIEDVQNDRNLRQNIKFLITSRENEQPRELEGNVKLQGFIGEDGIKFISEYCEINNISQKLSSDEIGRLLKESMGITLILVMAMEAINNGTMQFERIIKILEDSSSEAIKELGEYFFRETVDGLVRNDENIKNILLTLFYYEGADAVDISKLTSISIKNLEIDYLPKLSLKYILLATSSGYLLSDFAAHYVNFNFIIGHEQEVLELHKKVIAYQEELDGLLIKFENENDKAKGIINEWCPRNKAEKIANYFAYFAYVDMNNYMIRHNYVEIDNVIQNIEKSFLKAYEFQTTPYVLFQNAASLALIFDRYRIRDIEKASFLKERIMFLYENARSLCLSNRALLKEKSYPAMLYRYGMFFKNKINDSRQAIKFFKEALSILKLNQLTHEIVFYQICFDGIDTSFKAYDEEQILYFSEMFLSYNYESRNRKNDYQGMKDVAELSLSYVRYNMSKTDGSLEKLKAIYNKYEHNEGRRRKYFIRDYAMRRIERICN